MMHWSIQEICNATREISRFTTLGASGAHMKEGNAQSNGVFHCVATEKQGLKLEPNKKCNGDAYFKLIILGRSDLKFVKDLDI
jgi:hypothetical protein